MSTPQAITTDNQFETLFNQLHDPVVEFELLNSEPYIVQVNRAFKEVFAPDADSLTNLPLNELIVPDDRQAEAKQFDQRTAAGDPNRDLIERTTADGRRKFLYRGIPVGDDHGFAIYTDVTEKLRRERHLDALQRVLRHNLRNDLNVITGKATSIAETAAAEETREAARSIMKMADGLERLTEEAKTIQRILDDDTPLRPVDLSSAVDTVVDEYREQFPLATISCETPTAASVRADAKVRLIVTHLLDNAIRHNDSETVHVNVAVTQLSGSTIELSIADNGPGIPQTEREIITGETTTSPLKHGSGLGLWLVRWLVDRYGSTLEIKTPAEGGTIVRVRFAATET